MKHSLEAETLLTESSHPEARAFVYFTLGVRHDSRNRLDLATCATEHGIGLAGPDSDPEAYVNLLTAKAVIQRYKGDRSRAGLTIGRVRVLSKDAELSRVEHNIARWMLADDEVKKKRKITPNLRLSRAKNTQTAWF
jgi:hypothetical protein